MTPVIAPEAQNEIANALAISRNAGRLRIAVDRALAAIGANPMIATRIGRSRFRRYILTGRIPYSIIYTETADEIRVVAFAHNARRPGYWKNRLPKN